MKADLRERQDSCKAEAKSSERGPQPPKPSIGQHLQDLGIQRQRRLSHLPLKQDLIHQLSSELEQQRWSRHSTSSQQLCCRRAWRDREAIGGLRIGPFSRRGAGLFQPLRRLPTTAARCFRQAEPQALLTAAPAASEPDLPHPPSRATAVRCNSQPQLLQPRSACPVLAAAGSAMGR
jgi:hypothetical protein